MIRQRLEEIRDLLASQVERGCTANVTRAYVMTEAVLEMYFDSPDDVAILAALAEGEVVSMRPVEDIDAEVVHLDAKPPAPRAG
jgi:hypothetical protein